MKDKHADKLYFPQVSADLSGRSSREEASAREKTAKVLPLTGAEKTRAAIEWVEEQSKYYETLLRNHLARRFECASSEIPGDWVR